MKYQLVLQWPASSIQDCDSLIEIEDGLIEKLTANSVVDGHDAGSGEVNIFIRTNDPRRTFEEVRCALDQAQIWPDVRVAYRNLEATNYTVLWPTWLTEFHVA